MSTPIFRRYNSSNPSTNNKSVGVLIGTDKVSGEFVEKINLVCICELLLMSKAKGWDFLRLLR